MNERENIGDNSPATRPRPPPLQLSDATSGTSSSNVSENGYHTTTQSSAEKIAEEGRLWISNIGNVLNIDITTQQKAFVLFDKVLQCSTLSQLLENNVRKF